MATSIKSLLNRARESISGASTPAPGTPPNATPIDQLFPSVNPAVDGPDCDHECDSCEVKLPKGFKINEDDSLYGYVKGWSTHVLVATGKTDWVRDVEDEKKSVMEAFGKSGVKPSNGVRKSLQIIVNFSPALDTLFSSHDFHMHLLISVPVNSDSCSLHPTCVRRPAVSITPSPPAFCFCPPL